MANIAPKDIKAEYYDFDQYVSYERFKTFYHQVSEILRLKPKKILEVGVGSGVVKRILSVPGVEVKTCDINEALHPDYIGSVTELSAAAPQNEFDVVLCSRVLHHIPKAEVAKAIDEMLTVTTRYVVLVVAADNLRLYFSGRVTGISDRHLSIPLPGFLKRLGVRTRGQGDESYYRNWRIDSDGGMTRADFVALLAQRAKILKNYDVPTDHGHALFILEKRQG